MTELFKKMKRWTFGGHGVDTRVRHVPLPFSRRLHRRLIASSTDRKDEIIDYRLAALTSKHRPANTATRQPTILLPVLLLIISLFIAHDGGFCYSYCCVHLVTRRHLRYSYEFPEAWKNRQKQGNRIYRTPVIPARESVWVYAVVSNPCCPLLSYFEYMPFSRRLFLAIMCKRDVIQKTGST